MMHLKNKTWIWDIIFAVLAIGAGIFMIWKCRYGFANMDEAFYLTIPYRLCQGDGLFVQEWHLSQMSGFLLYPFMKLFLMTHNTLDGLFLTFRYIYTIIQILVSVFIYIRFRKTNHIGAGVASLVFMIYAPFGLMALSYNSMGIMCLAVTLTIMCTAKRIRWLQQMIAGLFFAAAVLCCPYLIIVYVVYLISAAASSIIRKRKDTKTDAEVFSMKSWLFFSIGAALLALIFAAFVLSRARVSDIIAAFPNIMNDSSHASKGLVRLVITYFSSILAISKAADLSYAVLFIAFVAAIADRKRKIPISVYLTVSALCTAVAIIFMVWYGNYINYVMFPLNLMGIVCAAACRNESTRKLTLTFWIPAMLYTVCLHASSNQEFFAISSASSVAVIPSIMMIAICTEHVIKEEKTAFRYVALVCAVVIFAGQIATVTVMRYKAVFWSSMDELQTECQQDSLEKGLYISEAADEQYHSTVRISNYINDNFPDEKNLLNLTYSTWIYLLCSDKYNSSFSGWIELGEASDQSHIDRLMAYYELNPQKIPDIILMEESSLKYMNDFEKLADYNITKLDDDLGIILNRIK